jgi:hypothetical protein
LLLLLVSPLNIAVVSTVPLPTFLLSDSGSPTAVDIHDVPIVPAATVISAVNAVSAVDGLPPCCCFTTFANNPTFIPVASFSAVVSSYTIAVILAVAHCWRHCYFLLSCCCLHSCCCWRPFVLDVPSNAGLHAILAPLVLLAFLLLLLSLVLLAFMLLLAFL